MLTPSAALSLPKVTTKSGPRNCSICMLVKAEALPVGLGNSRAKLAGTREPTSRLTLCPKRLSPWRLTNRPSQPTSFSASMVPK